jgi:hypothetical protein
MVQIKEIREIHRSNFLILYVDDAEHVKALTGTGTE